MTFWNDFKYILYVVEYDVKGGTTILVYSTFVVPFP